MDWMGVIVPTAVSPQYVVNVVYRAGRHPETYVRKPILACRAGQGLPHVYSQKEQKLCLFVPAGGKEWNSSMSIASTIVPWASEWLFFYEVWLATGRWLGGGVHLGSPKTETDVTKAD